MKIELKNIKFYEKLSEETNCFTADLYIDSKHTAYVQNEGRGGNTDIRWARKHDGDKERITQAEEYCKTLPDVDGLKMDLEFHVDLLFEDYLKAKAQKRLEKHMTTGICFGNESNYSIQTYKKGSKKITINELLQTENGKNLLRNTIKFVRGQNKIILNTNIPMDILEQSCITETII